NSRMGGHMALSLKDHETDRLAREVAALTGESLTEAVRRSLAERLERELLRRGASGDLAERLLAIGAHCAALPDRDRRPLDDLVGYDEAGLWR
ncbi:MAG TPA: type II toxin-antitoxin system VapB family antitoxin, partial [Rhodoblastus sp.]|nr:type II toxin-antitoxin system VapB family antitoxin [Rhodoblastus sp.]